MGNELTSTLSAANDALTLEKQAIDDKIKNDQYVSIEPVRFDFGAGITFVYCFQWLAARQVILAEELAIWKLEQQQREVSFAEMARVGSDEYAIKLGAILLRREKEFVLDDFNRGELQKVESYIANMNVEQYVELERCFVDFFTARGKRQLGSETLQRKLLIVTRQLSAMQGAIPNSASSLIPQGNLSGLQTPTKRGGALKKANAPK